MGRVPVALAILSAFAWTFLLLPVQIAAVALNLAAAKRIPLLYHRGLCRLFTLDVVTFGEICRHHPTLFVSNHSSYFDIPVLASLLEASFVAKIEVRSWPLLGLLARLQNSIFVSRRVTATQSASDVITQRLRAGDNLILFPEGTTSDGNRVLRFFSGLMGMAGAPLEGTDLMVQALTVAYTHQNGMPLGYARRSCLSWYGDMALGAHFWRALRGGRIRVEVRFHPAFAASTFTNRKALTRHCHQQVAAGLECSLHGREPEVSALDAKVAASHTRAVGTQDAA